MTRGSPAALVEGEDICLFKSHPSAPPINVCLLLFELLRLSLIFTVALLEGEAGKEVVTGGVFAVLLLSVWLVALVPLLLVVCLVKCCVCLWLWLWLLLIVFFAVSLPLGDICDFNFPKKLFKEESRGPPRRSGLDGVFVGKAAACSEDVGGVGRDRVGSCGDGGGEEPVAAWNRLGLNLMKEDEGGEVRLLPGLGGCT